MTPRALIVDDDAPIRDLLSTIVEQHGFSVDTASDGCEAIKSIDADGYDVVLLDLMMPRVDGYTVLRHIKEHRPEMMRCTIIATAVPERDVARNLNDPVFRIHQKPFDLQRLIDDVKECAYGSAA
jgi:DNA-binding response OmpR family regulator